MEAAPSSLRNPPILGSLELVAVWQQRNWLFPLPPHGTVTIGRATENDLCLDTDSVSRRHATLTVGSTLIIEDLSAANGTYLQQAVTRPGQTATLKPLIRSSAELRIGQPFNLGAVTAVVRHVRAAPQFDEVADPAKASVVVLDPNLQEVYAQARKAASANITVLVYGETGVGKELLASAIHRASPRARGPFLAINCGALSETLLEAELFGSEKGAFTGATQTRPGLFESANGGTIMLDEVGELSLTTQVKLLRVLEERAVLRVGARKALPIDVRFVAATNRDLEAEVEAGNFREDLYFRLSGLTLTIPPLRERPLEIEALARSFARASCEQLERSYEVGLSQAALSVMLKYDWPGNVRELRNVIERAVVLGASSVIDVDNLPEPLRRLAGQRVSSPPAPRANPSSPPPAIHAPPAHISSAVSGSSLPPPSPALGRAQYNEELKALEKERIIAALNQCVGNQTRAAELLGISRRTLVSRLAELDIPRPRTR